MAMKFAVIENAGYERERIVNSALESYRDACAWKDAHYAEDEQESLHVDIAWWDVAGSFWTYDF